MQPAYGLTTDQQTAYAAFEAFINNPSEQVFLLRGYSGVGKTYLTSLLYTMAVKVLGGSHSISLTATTNKAAQALSEAAGVPVKTIHSYLGLMVSTNYQTGVSTLATREGASQITQSVIFIDEASYVDSQLLSKVFERTYGCKIVFIGDPAQLAPIGCKTAPTFNAGFKGAHLSQVVRQAAGSPIIELATKFRHTVNTGEFFSFTPDGIHIVWLPRDKFKDRLEAEFIQPGWDEQESKVLAWTNKRVVQFNEHISMLRTGTPYLQEGDYAICNSYISIDMKSLSTEEGVLITSLSPLTKEYDVDGHYVTVNYSVSGFMPRTPTGKMSRMKEARKVKDYKLVKHIDTSWLDLRPAYASTVNKAQGSTYKKVFIDLDDISKCNCSNQVARMLYVASSRASHEVVFTGDIV